MLVGEVLEGDRRRYLVFGGIRIVLIRLSRRL